MSSNDQSNPNAAIPVYIGTTPSAARPSVVPIFSNNATTLIKTGAGTLQSVTVGTIGTNWVLTFYDAVTATGTPILVLSPTTPVTLPVSLPFSVGLTIVTSGSAAGNATITYK